MSRSARDTARHWAVAAWNAGRASAGYTVFRVTGEKPRWGIMGLRGLFTADPELPRRISRALTVTHPARPNLPVRGALGNLDREQITEIVRSLRTDGNFVFPQSLDPDWVDRLRSVGESMPRTASGWGGAAAPEFDPSRLVASRYLCAQADLVNASPVQELLADPTLAAVADAYLGCHSVQSDVGLWQSVVFDAEGRSASSQLFHSDRDHLQFVKFFVYLSDVTSETGPHVYVRESHRLRPHELRRDVRFTDEQIASHYDDSDVVEIVGPQGTVVVVDTSGLHMGKPPESGERWIIELEFGSSAFGPSAIPFDVTPASERFDLECRRDRRRFSRFRLLSPAR